MAFDASRNKLNRRKAATLIGAGAIVPLTACKARSSSSPLTASKASGDLCYIRRSLGESSRAICLLWILTRLMLDRIEKIDPRLRSYVTVMSDQAQADARAALHEIEAGRYRGPLHGVPIAIKDLCYAKGARTMGGTAVLKDFVPTFDATVVSKLRSAGAVVLGKLNLSEGASARYNPSFDVPINPWRADRWPGMSSSGSGVATAAVLCFASIGTDTGGSIRMPSSANGIVGLKPTYGRVSRYGVLAMAPSLDHVGPMARSVADAAIMFDAIAGYDPRDPTSLNEPQSNVLGQIDQGIKNVRIGLDRTYALKGIDSGQAAALENAISALESLGARIVEVKMPSVADVVDTWMPICSFEMAVAHAANYPSRASEYGPYLREFLASGLRVTTQQLSAARKRRAELTTQFAALLNSIDAIAGPAGGDPAWPITHELPVGPMAAYHAAWSAAAPRSSEFTMPMDLAGVPAICLPCRFAPEGVPYSIQFTGRRMSEGMLCRIAHVYEQATSWHDRHPEG